MQTGETLTVSVSEQTVQIDPASWVDQHGDYLFRYAVVRLRDESRAEDCVQDALLSAIQSMASYGGKSTERTWLTGILKHKIIDYFRKHSREVPLDPRIWRRSPDEALQENEFFGVLQGCMSKLPERVASVFALREMNGLDTDEICEILSLSSSNFWVMMHRARMALRRCIEINWFMKAK
jgi:RNA polymerase sigma-70 factor (ECF subfamily)